MATSNAFVMLISEYGRVTPFNSLQDWVTIISLAERFDFEGIKTLALNSIEQLPNLTGIEKINLSRQYDIRPDWIFVSLVQLVQREDPITKEEITLLGADYAALLAGAREKWLKADAHDSLCYNILCPECTREYSRELDCKSCGGSIEAYYDAEDEGIDNFSTVADLVRTTFNLDLIQMTGLN
jgi:hypothetical protein